MSDVFYEIAKDAILKKRESIKDGCDRCRDVKPLCPSCQKIFGIFNNIYKANLPLAKAKTILNHQLKELQIKEYDFATGKFTESLNLYNDLMTPYCAAAKTVAEEGYSLFFVGKNSAGKTVSSVYSALGFIRAGMSVYYLTFPRLHQLNTESFKDDTGTINKLLRSLQEVDLLIVDELGKETNASQSVRYLADTFLKAREENALPTILISNLQIDYFKDVRHNSYGPSFWAMLGQKYRIFEFSNSHDLRVQNRQAWDI